MTFLGRDRAAPLAGLPGAPTAPFLLLALATSACSPADADGDGFPYPIDCDDGATGVHPGAAEPLDGQDNDCSGAADDGDYRRVEVPEEHRPGRGVAVVARSEVPDDAPWDECWLGGDALSLGLLAPRMDEPVLVEGAIEWFALRELFTYDRSDSDCFSFWLPVEGWVHARLDWGDPGTDLDMAITAPWPGEGAAGGATREFFALAEKPNDLEPPPVEVTTSATFPAGTPVFVWVVGYSGEPIDYRLTLWASAP